jgi:hypothetical protein
VMCVILSMAMISQTICHLSRPYNSMCINQRSLFGRKNWVKNTSLLERTPQNLAILPKPD